MRLFGHTTCYDQGSKLRVETPPKSAEFSIQRNLTLPVSGIPLRGVGNLGYDLLPFSLSDLYLVGFWADSDRSLIVDLLNSKVPSPARLSFSFDDI